jgi:hypothetical protein
MIQNRHASESWHLQPDRTRLETPAFAGVTVEGRGPE